VAKGEPLCLLHVRTPGAGKAFVAPVASAFTLGARAPAPAPLVLQSL